MKELKLKMVYDFIVEYVLTHGYAPCTKEICQGTGYSSTSTINHAMKELFEKGLLETDIEGNSKRAYRVKELEIRRRF